MRTTVAQDKRIDPGARSTPRVVRGPRIGRSARVAKDRDRSKSNAGRPRRESGRALLYGITLLVVGGLLAFLFGSSGADRRGKPLPVAESTAPRDPPASTPARLPVERAPAPTPPESADQELAPFVSLPNDSQAFEGSMGSLRGHIEVSGEESFPKAWRLVARPSRYLAGREFAHETRVEFQDGRQDFEISALSLGAYDVFGEADGFNGQPIAVRLEKGNEHPFLNLRLVPCGVLEGRIVDATGLPAEGIPITLLQEGVSDTREALTDGSGRYRFETLPDGAYDLLVGRPSAPILPERRPVLFAAPRLTFPDVELPPLATLHVRVVDSLARPLEGVEVVGSGTNGGLIDGHTDFNGELTVHHLPAGHFRLRLQHPTLGAAYARRVAVDLVAGETGEAPVRLGP